MAMAIKWEPIRRNLDRIVFGVLFVLFLAVLIIFVTEMSSPGPPYMEPPIKKPEPLIPEDEYNKVKILIQNYPSLDKNENYASLGRYDIFSYKTVRDRDVILKELDKKYEEAEMFYSKGQVNYAKETLKDILLTWPSHLKAQNLMKTIRDQEKKEGEEAS